MATGTTPGTFTVEVKGKAVVGAIERIGAIGGGTTTEAVGTGTGPAIGIREGLTDAVENGIAGCPTLTVPVENGIAGCPTFTVPVENGIAGCPTLTVPVENGIAGVQLLLFQLKMELLVDQLLLLMLLKVMSVLLVMEV